MFENDVKEYGFQTSFCPSGTAIAFENDVKEYGFQTPSYNWLFLSWFENDVKEYGFQTCVNGIPSSMGLRMM